MHREHVANSALRSLLGKGREAAMPLSDRRFQTQDGHGNEDKEERALRLLSTTTCSSSLSLQALPVSTYLICL